MDRSKERSKQNSVTSEGEESSIREFDGSEAKALPSGNLTESEDLLPESTDPQIVAESKRLIGTTIANRYLVQRCIGAGGMGMVYLAQHKQLDRQVVIKIMRPTSREDGESRARFEREARGLSKLDHPNIVTIHDFGKDQGLWYIVMEHVDGHTLHDRLNANEPIGLAEFGMIATQILDAIGSAHRRDLIHRDLKPSNIMLCEKQGKPNFVKILDFGLAKLLLDRSEVTKQNSVVGSVSYMSPEQILGREVDQRVDVYALGILFYYMLTGNKPFSGQDEVGILYQHVHSQPEPFDEALPDGHEVPFGIQQLVFACLAKEPDERPQDATEVLDFLRATVETSEVLHTPWDTTDFSVSNLSRKSKSWTNPSWLRQPSKKSSDFGRWKWAATASIVIAVVGGIFMAANGASTDQQASQPAPKEVVEVEEETSEPDSGVNLERIEALIDEGKYSQAELLLKSTAEQRQDDPALMERATALQVTISTRRLMQRAAEQERQGKFAEATATYDKVLDANSSHPQAKARRQELASYPVIAIDAEPDASVWMNGRILGTTPFNRRLKPGSYTFELKAEKYETWSKTIKLEKEQRERLDLELEAISSNQPRRKRRTRRGSSGSSDPSNKGAKKRTQSGQGSPSGRSDRLAVDKDEPQLLIPNDTSKDDDDGPSVPLMISD